MNWQRFFRACCCLLVVAAILCNCSPIRVNALAAESLLLYGDDIISVFVAILKGLGIIASASVLASTASDLAEAAQNGYTSSSGNIIQFPSNYGGNGDDGSFWFKVLERSFGAGSILVADEVLEWILNWLVDSAIIRQQTMYEYGEGAKLTSHSKLTDADFAFWQNIDIYNIAADADPGQIIMLSAGSSSLPCYAWGLARQSTTYGIDILTTVGINQFSMAPYSGLNFPLGEFVNLNSFNSVSVAQLSSNTGTCARTIFMTYDDAYAAYNNSAIQLEYYYYLTPQSYMVPRSGSASNTGRHDICISDIYNMGQLTSGGSVTIGNFSISIGSGYNSYPYIFTPLSSTSDAFYQSSIGESGYIGDPSLGVEDSYPDWSDNAVQLDGVLYFPLGVGSTINNTVGLTQKDIWNGNNTPSKDPEVTTPVLDPDSVAGSNADTFIGKLVTTITAPIQAAANTVVTGVTQVITDVFVPSEDFVTSKVDALRAEFAFADSIISTGQAIGGALNDFETSPPVIYMDLSLAESEYDWGGKAIALDLRWYERYKPFVDGVLSSIIWVLFAWRTFRKLPSIISGVAGDVQVLNQSGGDV